MKNIIKYNLVLVLLLAISLLTVACSSEEKGIEFEGALNFTGTGNEFSVLYNDIYKMDSVTRDVHSVTSTGEELDNKVRGVLLESILQENGISKKDFDSLRLIAEDGYEINVPKEILEKEIILAYDFDGNSLIENEMPLRIAIDNVRSMFFVSKLKEINFSASDMKKEEHNSNKKIIILETAIKDLDIVDDSIKINDLFEKHLKFEDEIPNELNVLATDNFKKTELYSIFKSGDLKLVDENAPMFFSPDLPLGMHIKKILSIDVENVLFSSIESAYEVFETVEIEGVNGIPIDKFLDSIGISGDTYLFLAADGYERVLEKDKLSNGIIFIDDKGVCSTKFDKSMPKSAGIMDLLSISIADKAVDNKAVATEKVKSTEWIITFEGLSDGKFDFTSSKAERNLEFIDLHTERTKGDEKFLEDWKGYKLNDVLKFLRVDDFNSIEFIASDGYKIELPKENIDDETILATEMNGERFNDYNVQLVQNTKFATTWIRDIVKIIIK